MTETIKYERHIEGADVFTDLATGQRFTVVTEDHGRCDNGHAVEADGSCGECAS